LRISPSKNEIYFLFASDEHSMTSSLTKWLAKASYDQTNFLNDLTLDEYYNFALLKFLKKRSISYLN